MASEGTQAAADPPQLVSRASDAAPVETIDGRGAVLKFLEQAERLARLQIRVIDRPAAVSPDPDVELRPEWSMLRRGGVRRRVLYDSAGLDSLHQLTRVARRGVTADEARAIRGVPVAAVLFDNQLAVVSRHVAPDGVDSLILVRPSPLCDALDWLFEQLWERAVPLQRGTAAVAGLASRDRQLLLLLTSGLDDQTIAQHLEIDERVLQRRIRSLLKHLGAPTRLQAARRAASLGWIPLSPDDETAGTLG